jgi:FAD/FMN-containing dehydrogenase
VSALEYVDAATAGVLGRFAGQRWPAGVALLLVEVEGSEAEEGEALARLEAARGRFPWPEDPLVYPDAERLWKIRGDAGPALQADGGPGLREDVAVPRSQLDALLAEVRALAARHGTGVRIFGHVGEGNLHPVFAVDPSTPEADRIRNALCDATLRLGGTLSGEHGLGATKRERLPDQLGGPGVAVLRALKAAFDPHGILNPGKLLPETPPSADPPPFGSPSAGGAPRTPPA